MTNPERRSNLPRRAALGLIGLGLVALADQVVNEGRVTDAIMHFGQQPTPATMPTLTTTPAATVVTEAPTATLSPTDAADKIVNNGCHPEVLSPHKSGFAKLVTSGLLKQKDGVSTYGENDLETVLTLPGGDIGVTESGTWRLERDTYYVRVVYGPDLKEGNTEDKLLDSSHGTLRTGDEVYSGYVQKPVLQDGLSTHVRANYFFISIAGDSDVCTTMPVEEVAQYMQNPGIVDGYIGIALNATKENSFP